MGHTNRVALANSSASARYTAASASPLSFNAERFDLLGFQRTDYKPFTPRGSAIELMASNAAIWPQHFQNRLWGGQSQYSAVELMSVRQQNDSKVLSL